VCNERCSSFSLVLAVLVGAGVAAFYLVGYQPISVPEPVQPAAVEAPAPLPPAAPAVPPVPPSVP
jgi:hypothetical protein